MSDQSFRLTEYFPSVSLTWSGAAWEADDTSYVAVVAGSSSYWMFSSQIDVGGWTKRELTAFFANQYTQKAGSHLATGAVDPALGGIEGTDKLIVTDVPLSESTASLTTLRSAGFMDNPSDYMTIKFMEGTALVQTSNAPNVMSLNDRYQCGSGDPTAAGTLYCYRILDITKAVGPSFVAGDAVRFPQMRYVAEGISAKEPPWIHIDRLRRSYELATVR